MSNLIPFTADMYFTHSFVLINSSEDEYRAYNAPFANGGVMKMIWSNDVVESKGKYYNIQTYSKNLVFQVADIIKRMINVILGVESGMWTWTWLVKRRISSI